MSLSPSNTNSKLHDTKQSKSFFFFYGFTKQKNIDRKDLPRGKIKFIFFPWVNDARCVSTEMTEIRVVVANSIFNIIQVFTITI